MLKKKKNYTSVTATVQFCLKFNGNVQHPPVLTVDQCIASSLTWLIKADIYCALPGASRSLLSPSASSPLPELGLRNKARVGVCSTQSSALASLAEQLGAASWALCCAGPCCGTFQFGSKRCSCSTLKHWSSHGTVWSGGWMYLGIPCSLWLLRTVQSVKLSGLIFQMLWSVLVLVKHRPCL